MSNKNYKNYNAISSTKPTEVEVKEEVKVEETTPVVEEVKAETTPVVEQPKPEPPKTLTGKVAGCAKLNVRKTPSKDGEVLAIINEGSEVVINKIKSTMDFYAVCTATGVEGFCMKKFIAPVK